MHPSAAAPVAFESSAISAPAQIPAAAAAALGREAFTTFSHSPSALHEDPWLRYL
jgi:hypothetical protein